MLYILHGYIYIYNATIVPSVSVCKIMHDLYNQQHDCSLCKQVVSPSLLSPALAARRGDTAPLAASSARAVAGGSWCWLNSKAPTGGYKEYRRNIVGKY